MTAELKKRIKTLGDYLDLPQLRRQKEEIEAQLQDSTLWADTGRMTMLNRKLKLIEHRLIQFNTIEQDAQYLDELQALGDESLAAEIVSYENKVQTEYDELELQTLLSDAHDDGDVIFTINAGAGGTDAQDWAEMLLRMFVRWVEKKGFEYQIIDISEGEEAGIKSATLEIRGDYAYGLMKSEHGIHRLVRLSPFNANNKRQTSFASVDVIPLIERSTEVEIGRAHV